MLMFKKGQICLARFNLMRFFSNESMASPIVAVKQGKLKGSVKTLLDGKPYYSFKGIRYGQPPVGKLRFKAPLPVKPWDGILEAIEHGSVCPQLDLLAGDLKEGNEDCLFLNVYTKSLEPSSKTPALVYIHGGGYMSGSGNCDTSVERAFRLGKALGKETKNADELLEFLQKIPAIDLAGATRKTRTPDECFRGLSIFFTPVVEKRLDGVEHFLTEEPINLLLEGKVSKVPLLIGYNSREGILIAPDTLKKNKVINETPSFLVPRQAKLKISEEKLKEFGDRIKSFYVGKKDFEIKTADAISNLQTDLHFSYEIQRFINFYHKYAPVYFYKFDYDTDLNIPKSLVGLDLTGASHADDLFYFFYNMINKDYYHNQEKLQKIVYQLTKFWTEFARTGNPSAEGINWPLYTPSGGEYMLLNEQLSVKSHADKERGGENRMKSLIRFGREAIKNGGTTLLWVGAHCYVVTVDPVDIEVILKTFVAKDDIMRFARSFIGNGLIFAPVPIWRARRKVAAPTFSPYKLKNFVTIFARQSSVMVDKLKSVADNEVVSVWKYVTTFTLDSVCETVLGVSINSQENSEHKLLKAFDTVCKLTAERMMQPWLQPDIVYKLLPQHLKYKKNKRIVYEFVDEIIKSVRQTLKENSEIEKSNPERIKSFLELLIESSGGENGYSDRELLEETLVMMVAGTDTSAVGSSFTIRMLADYPDVQEKVFKELQDVFSDSDRPVTTEDLVHLKYLDAVIKETLRLYPPVPVIVREIDENIKLPSGVTLKKGCGLTVHIWGTHRNPVYWGDDAEQFRPERFIEAPPKHPAAFQAFSSGPRSCLGYLYAMMSMKTALATLLRSYRILSADENRISGTVHHEPLKVTFDVMMKDVDGFRVKLVKRIKD
ncbi:unnamed protein product [Arctia plantaginis]|uniref:Carboxylesterase type B domain-containing protein n=1 Tax=Arctia plantaginis TaxID=874455 RepID=A0A8S0Z542_ARCPL|nr:unnamed protein product [Arctia plantaginis]